MRSRGDLSSPPDLGEAVLALMFIFGIASAVYWSSQHNPNHDRHYYHTSDTP